MHNDHYRNIIDSYESALDFLYQFVNYERKMTEIYAPEKMDPFRPARLLYAVGEPHRQFPSIHIAGTKGKGSVAAMCATALRAAGLRVGLYTSPHLVDLRERIRVLTPEDRQGNISAQAFVQLVNELRPVTERMEELTWFELVTALAFMHFAQRDVNVAVVEVGLGGRLDATNVLTPIVSVITSLSLDHTGLLGNTVAEIAAEKGGIIKQGVPVVSASQPAAAMVTIERIAAEHKAPLTVVGREWQFEGRQQRREGVACTEQTVTVTVAPNSSPLSVPEAFTLALNGEHQQENAVVALAALNLIRPHLPRVSLQAMRCGLADVHWPARLQVLNEGRDSPTLLLDGAHNADSAQKLASYLQAQCRYGRLWLILGVTADKNVPGILQPLLPLTDSVIVTKADNPRATETTVLKEAAGALGYDVEVQPDITAAVTAAWRQARAEDLICVAGSLYIAGDLLNCWDVLKSRLLGEQVR